MSIVAVQTSLVKRWLNIRFGSKADMCVAKSDVCFTPNSDRESEIPQKAMSGLPPKADMCSALVHVCFGPKAKKQTLFDHLARHPLAAYKLITLGRIKAAGSSSGTLGP